MQKLGIRLIEDADDHAWAMQQIDALMPDGDLSEQGVRDLKALAILVEEYENKHFPVRRPTRLEAIEFRQDQEMQEFRNSIA